MKKLLFLLGLLYVTFLYMDINDCNWVISSDIIKYGCILLCFSMSFIVGKNPLNRKDIKLLQCGLFFTLLADLCLLFIPSFFSIGVLFFSIVQITYTIRYNINKKEFIIKWFIFIFGIILTMYAIAWFIAEKMDFLFLVTGFYAVCLLSSVSSAIFSCFKKAYPKPNNILILSGMLFFLLCDINVGLSNAAELISNTGSQTETMAAISRQLIWLFYLPSQVLLSLSGHNFKRTNPLNNIKLK